MSPRSIVSRHCWLATILLISTGCGGGGPSAHAVDPNEAQKGLETVLDAWKAGQSPKDFASRTPPIHFNDADWQGGFRLVNYKPADEGKLAGFDMVYTVNLELESPKGKAVKKTAVYTITTRPELMILRQEG